MSDVVIEPEQPAGAPPAAAPASFGPTLLAARQALGLSTTEVAARLRLHPRQIAALESEQLAALPERTFVRGFIRNYAKEVGLDPAPLLQAFDAQHGARAPTPAAAGSASPARLVQGAERERLSRQLVIAGVLVALVVLGGIGWLASQRPSAPATVPLPAPKQEAPPAPTGQAAPAVTPALEPVAVPAAAPAPTAASPAPAAAEGSRAPAPAGSLLLRFAVGERPSWIEVVQQADGKVVYSGLNDAGSERRVLAVPPVRVAVGNASTVTLEFRGQSVDLAPHTRSDDLARLTLQ